MKSRTSFESLPIPELVLQGIRDAGFKYCTPIQAMTLPITLAGKDVAGQAQTGTGKTAAFLITIFTQLLKEPPPKPTRKGWVGPRALVIAPTRELARQIEKDARLLGAHCNLKIVSVYGGMEYQEQKDRVKKGVDLMIVTPGRLIDYYKQKVFSLKGVEVLVVDEADRMFDMGFISDLRYIFRNMTPYDKRLSMLYSATLSHRVLELCYEHMNLPERIAIEPEKITVDEVEQFLYHVGSDEKFNLLLGFLQRDPDGKFLIFCNTKQSVEHLEAKLKHNHFNAEQISGDIHQRKRIKVLEKFSTDQLDILIATDVASRGIHIDNITHVINYDLPQDSEDYIHRIGRTARAGASGTAITLSCEDYVQHLEGIESLLKEKITVVWPQDEMFAEARAGGPRRRPRRRSAPAGKNTSQRPRTKSSSGQRRPSRPRGSRPRR